MRKNEDPCLFSKRQIWGIELLKYSLLLTTFSLTTCSNYYLMLVTGTTNITENKDLSEAYNNARVKLGFAHQILSILIVLIFLVCILLIHQFFRGL